MNHLKTVRQNPFRRKALAHQPISVTGNTLYRVPGIPTCKRMITIEIHMLNA